MAELLQRKAEWWRQESLGSYPRRWSSPFAAETSTHLNDLPPELTCHARVFCS